MAFKDGSGNIVITDEGVLNHSGFREPSSPILANTETKITASDGASTDRFGFSVAVGSGRICVGAYRNDDAGSNSGSAYIFDLDGNELTKITASDGASDDNFGFSVAVGSGRIVVGARFDDDAGTDSGSAYIFDLDGNELAKITASDADGNDRFGTSVAVGSGRIVVGAYRDDPNGTDSGSAYIFDLDGNELTKITASDGFNNDGFGESVAVGSGRICVGAYLDDDNGTDSGSAYIFDLDGNELTKITASDGASGDEFGRLVAVGSGRIVVGAYFANRELTSGAAYIYDLDGNELTKITASGAAANDRFGQSVAVGSGRICVGAYRDNGITIDDGSVYIYDLDGNESAKINASDAIIADFFGASVAVGSGRIVSGAWGSNAKGSNSGSAYIYDLGEDYNTYIESIIDTKQV